MLNKPVPELGVDELTRLWTEATSCDKSTFAEMRTNLQIVAGQHYLTEGSPFFNRIRDNKQLTDSQRLKLTKNHTQRATSIYRNAIEDVASDCAMEPANENELGDQKSAQLNQSYWEYIKRCEDFERKRSLWAKHFVEIGEVWVKAFWNMDGGQEIGNEVAMIKDEASGEMVPQKDESGNYVLTDNVSYSGKMKWETIEAYRLKRDPAAVSFEDSPYLMVDKIIPIKSLSTMFKDKELIEKLKQSKSNENMVIYDGNSRTYKTAVDQVIIRECYWRPGPGLKKGFYHFFTDVGIIAKGELPYGIFPLVGETFEDQTGNPRGITIIRSIRPAQVEINRCASKIAEHQITLGDDKAWVSANTKVSQGATLPGIRVNTYSGMKPEITEGRSGEQYVPYLESQIKELYTLANLQEIMEPQQESPDLYANLLKSYRFKKKFSIYGSRFERFLVKLAEVSLAIAKQSCHEEEVVPAIGRSERINIAEFKNSEDLKYRIKIKPRSGDIETQFGQQISINHVLQYVGQNLPPDQVGKMIRLSPFMNSEQMFSDLTNKYDNIVNDILALDRGQARPPRRYDDHKYIIENLSARISKPDFEFLPEQVRMLYDQKIKLHEQMQAQAMQEIERLKAGFIPSGGYMVKCDFYTPDPKNPGNSKRLALPSEAVGWLVDTLAKQGSEIDSFDKLPPGVLQEIGGMVNPPQQGGPPMMPGAMNAAG